MLDLKADPIGYVTNNPALWTDEEADKMFVVTANGNGMINAGIHDRDMLFFCISRGFPQNLSEMVRKPVCHFLNAADAV